MTTKRGMKATINPALLLWARKSAGYEIAEAAHKLQIDEERVTAFEAGEDQPTIPQLRKMAETYNRPLAVFYLPEPPLTFRPMHDFRRMPELGARRFSPGLTLEIRNAHQRRTLALEIFDDMGEKPAKFTLETRLASKVDDVGKMIREALGIDYKLSAISKIISQRSALGARASKNWAYSFSKLLDLMRMRPRGLLFGPKSYRSSSLTARMLIRGVHSAYCMNWRI